MAITISIPSFHDDVERHAAKGWQCPECYGVQVNRQESRFGGPREDRFTCQECGAQWGRG